MASDPVTTSTMDASLLRHEIDEDLVADLGPGPDALALRAHVLAPAELPRLALPPGLNRVLLVVFRLNEAPPEPAVPPASAAASAPWPPASWHLTYDFDVDRGQPQLHRHPLILPPLRGPATWTPRSGASTRAPVDGMVYRGAWWVDLSRLIQDRVLSPGQRLRVDYRSQAQAEVAMR